MTVTKYSASGNDFVILIVQEKEDRSELAKQLCHRQNGVGADGLVVVLPHKKYDFEWQFYNADGSSADMCGNASRAVAHFAHEKGISKNGIATFLTTAGVIHANINGLYVVSDMVAPKIISENIDAYGENAWLINTGVPHLVIMRENIDTFSIQEAKKLRDQHDCNVNIYCIKESVLYVRTYERGVEDETLACGTGIVACFVRAYKEGKVSEKNKVYPKSGDELYVNYEEDVYRFAGKVSKVFTAEVLL